MYFILPLLLFLSSCVYVPVPQDDSKQVQKQPVSEKITAKDETKYSEWFDAHDSLRKEGFFESQSMENGFGCSGGTFGEGKNRYHVISLITIPTCKSSYGYRAKMTFYCQSPGDIQVPIKAKGKTLYWTLKNKKGSLSSDWDGVGFLSFVSDENFDLKSNLKLALDEDFKKNIPTSETVYLPAEACRKN